MDGLFTGHAGTTYHGRYGGRLSVIKQVSDARLVIIYHRMVDVLERCRDEAIDEVSKQAFTQKIERHNQRIAELEGRESA